MAFERLDSVVKRVVSRIANEVGEGVSAATDPDAAMSKKRPSRSPAKFQEVVSRDTGLLTQEGQVSRKQRIAPGSPIPAVAGPMPAVRCFLVIEGGGRPATSGGTGRAAYAQARGGSHASNLVLIEGGRRHWTASAF